MSSSAPVTVRPARPQDADAMGQLAQVAYQPYVARIGRRPAPMTADYTAITSAGHAWVAEHCGRLAGLLVLAPAEDHLLLDNVAVAPDAQGLGAGTRLLRLAEKQAQEQGLAEVRLYTNEAMTENLTNTGAADTARPTAASTPATAACSSRNLSPAAARTAPRYRIGLGVSG